MREVDLKLIELAKLYEGKIITNDFNLNKVAQLQGVDVLNINELANSLKPIVLPGETMKVFILKEGKEYNQGVAYLDDGTMVVVDNARKMIGKTIDISVTSVLQTTAGKMIFGKWDDRSSSSLSRSSISKQRGAEMSSRFMPPKAVEIAFTVRTISSGSFVLKQIGKALMPPNSLKSIALPSITGMAAAGPMSPRPSTAVPSVTMATVFFLIVRVKAFSGSL